jgi:hypothetical protein
MASEQLPPLTVCGNEEKRTVEDYDVTVTRDVMYERREGPSPLQAQFHLDTPEVVAVYGDTETSVVVDESPRFDVRWETFYFEIASDGEASVDVTLETLDSVSDERIRKVYDHILSALDR